MLPRSDQTEQHSKTVPPAFTTSLKSDETIDQGSCTSSAEALSNKARRNEILPKSKALGAHPPVRALHSATKSNAGLKTNVVCNHQPNPSATIATATTEQEKQLSSVRLQRSRERNRMHARKTRQRKKEQMHILKNRTDELKKEQIRLRQVINEKNTATILLGMFSTFEAEQGGGKSSMSNNVEPEVEALLKRPVEDIPDEKKVPELPALILPGQHNSKKGKMLSSVGASGTPSVRPQHEQSADDGIDYELLGKDRSKCTPAELDQIRRERNRMHAKRTRDRKRIFMEEMEVIIKQLEGENTLLQNHIDRLNAEHGVSPAPQESPTSQSPASLHTEASMLAPGQEAKSVEEPACEAAEVINSKIGQEPRPTQTSSIHAVTADQIRSLLAAADAHDKQKKGCMGMLAISSVASAAVSASTDPSVSGSLFGDEDHSGDTSSFNAALSQRPNKRQCIEGAVSSPDVICNSVPTSITTGGTPMGY